MADDARPRGSAERSTPTSPIDRPTDRRGPRCPPPRLTTDPIVRPGRHLPPFLHHIRTPPLRQHARPRLRRWRGRYHPKDALASTIKAISVTGTAGLVVSGAQNALARENRGLLGLFTKTGGTVAMFVLMGGTYAFLKDASANLREKSDPWNAALGGFFAGALVGIPSGRMPRVVGFGTGLAITLSIFEYTGNSLRGAQWREPEVDEFERKEKIRLLRHIPFEDTIAEIGEGRGVWGPGFKERRAELLKQKYGVDVPVVPEKPYAT
ncbi:hypothetical protein DRE_02885 [Drechslerella stenobrocha 248]|uniref:NADH-ubiquinone oxidoreductase 21.3 kDa subunit n=1 Tax=Drechslerella stenobrocha 248 TaxID=1043628 RepID=W7I6W6_9PEZI|nr:hypothetical protein DRE_02885 [Drechslerella stenobrocha 248]